VLLQITPDYTEYFYDELRPNVHYIPASLDNITEVARYIVDKANESEMKNVVKAARSWCKRKMTKDAIAADVMTRLEMYFKALDAYREQEDWKEWNNFISFYPFRNLVECDRP
jgi:uncharacterized protein (DUF2384 family)